MLRGGRPRLRGVQAGAGDSDGRSRALSSVLRGLDHGIREDSPNSLQHGAVLRPVPGLVAPDISTST